MEVTQEDREAAAAYMAHFRPAGWENAVAQIPLGNADLGEGVQAFARHRITALAAKEAENAELRAKVEKLREALSWYAEQLCEGFGECVGDFCGKCSNEDCAGCKAFATLAETQP